MSKHTIIFDDTGTALIRVEPHGAVGCSQVDPLLWVLHTCPKTMLLLTCAQTALIIHKTLKKKKTIHKRKIHLQLISSVLLLNS